MGAPKAREIVRLSEDRSIATVRADWRQPTYEVPTRFLKRAEVIRAAKVAFPNVPGNLWISQDKDATVDAILSGTLPANIGQAQGPSNGPDNAAALCAAQDEIARLRDALDAALAAPTAEPVSVPPSTDHRHPMFDTVFRLLAAGKNVYLVGPAGTGKSTLARHAADAMGAAFYAMSCHAQMTGAALTGYNDAQGRYVSTDWRHAYVGDLGRPAGVYCLDEIDNGNPNILAALNSALANGHCSFADGGRERHPDFRMVATANTFGTGATAQYVGRNPLDLATKDRFWIVEIDYDQAFELDRAAAYGQRGWAERMHAYRAKIAEHGLKIVISTRAVIEGAEMLAAGFDLESVLSMRVFAGVPADQVSKIRAADKDLGARRSVNVTEPPASVPEPQSSGTVRAGWRMLTSEYDGKCAECGTAHAKGARIAYNGTMPRGRKVLCAACAVK